MKSDQKSLNGIQILVAEDAYEIRLLMARMLTRYGACVVTASDGADAIAKIAERSFDIVLMDIQMPNMDGRTAARQLRAGGYSKPLIALTGHALDDEIKKSKQAGFDDHLVKPIELTRLIRTVQLYANPLPGLL